MNKHILTLIFLLTCICQQTLMAQTDGGRLVLYMADSSLVTYPASQLVDVTHAAKAGEGLTVRTLDAADHYALTDIQRMEWERGGMEIVDLGLSVNWASCNVGANVSEEVGTFGGEVPNSIWRVPTTEEVSELFYLCDWQELTLNGQPCYKVTGPNGRSIVLPRSGYKRAALHCDKGIAVAMQTSSSTDVIVIGPQGLSSDAAIAPLRAVTPKDVETSAGGGIRLTTLEIQKEDNTANSFLLCARMELEASADTIATYGFLLSTDSLPTEQNSSMIKATNTNNNYYYARVYNLPQDSAYYFRAYAVVDGQKVYGNVKRVDFSYNEEYVEWVGLYDVTPSSVTLKAEALPIYQTENKDIRAGFHVSYTSDGGTDTQDYDLWTTLEASGHYTAQVPAEQAGFYAFSAIREIGDSVQSDGVHHIRRGSFKVEAEEGIVAKNVYMTETAGTAWEVVESTSDSISGHGYLYISPTISTRQTALGLYLSDTPLWGTYDISIRLLPPSLQTDTLTLPQRFRANLYTCEEDEDWPTNKYYKFESEEGSRNFECSGTQASTIHLGTYTFCGERAILQLGSYVITSQRSNFTKEMLLDCIMMEEQTEDTILQKDTILVPKSVSLYPTERYSLPTQTVEESGSHRRVARRADEETRDAKWESSDSNVATVDASGIVTATGKGTAIVKDVSTGDSCIVRVTLPVDYSTYYEKINQSINSSAIAGLRCDDEVTLYLGRNAVYEPSVWYVDEDGNRAYNYNTITMTIQIASSNEDVVKPSRAQFTASMPYNFIALPSMEVVGIGTAYITISTDCGWKCVQKVEVKEYVRPTSIQLATHELSLSLDDDAREIDLTIEPDDYSVTDLGLTAEDISNASVYFNYEHDTHGNEVSVKNLKVVPRAAGSEKYYVGLYEDGNYNKFVKMDSILVTIPAAPVFRTQKFTRNDSSATLEVEVTRVPALCTASLLLGLTPELTAENAQVVEADSIVSTGFDWDYSYSLSFSLSGLDPAKTYYMLPQITCNSYQFKDSTYQGEVVTGEAAGSLQGVDLGLSVRWADRNVGASITSAAGDYYAWGEDSVKTSCSLSNYAYLPANTFLTGYAFSATDDLDFLSLGTDGNISASEYDAATVTLDSAWRMPTLDEMQELVEKCSWQAFTHNGTDGFLVTGPSGKSIFLPCAGSSEQSGTFACYWTAQSVSGDSYRAHILNVVKGADGQQATPYIVKDMRWLGLPIRPVAR